MPRQSVFRMVDRQHLPGSQVGRGLRQLIGQRMYIAPVGIVLPVFENGEVDLREALSDLREMASVTAVAADIDLPRGGLQQEGGPQRLIGIQPPAREVTRCQAEDPDSLHWTGILVPVQFDDPLRSESPAFEMFADTQRTDDLSDAVFQFADRTVIEVVPMVVGDDEQIYRRHILRAVEVAARKGPVQKPQRSGAPENRVHENPPPARKDQVGGVSEPDQLLPRGVELPQIGSDGSHGTAGRRFSVERNRNPSMVRTRPRSAVICGVRSRLRNCRRGSWASVRSGPAAPRGAAVRTKVDG